MTEDGTPSCTARWLRSLRWVPASSGNTGKEGTAKYLPGRPVTLSAGEGREEWAGSLMGEEVRGLGWYRVRGELFGVSQGWGFLALS